MDVLLYLEEMNPVQPRAIAIAKPKGSVRKSTIFSASFDLSRGFLKQGRHLGLSRHI